MTTNKTIQKLMIVIVAALLLIGVAAAVDQIMYSIPPRVAGESSPVVTDSGELIGLTFPVVLADGHYIHLIDTTGEFVGFVHPVNSDGEYPGGQLQYAQDITDVIDSGKGAYDENGAFHTW